MPIRLTTLSLILAVAACTPTASPSAETSPTVTKTAIDTAYWTEQPYCSGRYQLRLPSKRRHGSTHLGYNGWSVMVMFNDWNRNVRNINEFKQRGRAGTKIVVDTRTLIPDRAMMQVRRGGYHWENIIGKDGMPYEADLYFKLDNDDAYIVRSFFYIPAENGKAPANWKAQEKEAINTIEKKFRQEILSGLKTRQEFEVPNKHGICLIGGFISDDGKKQFEVHSTVEFAKQHDMSLEIMHGDVLKAGEATLLKRKVNLDKGAIVKALTHTIRQGKRTING
ncbi:hypothetical protein HMPREF3277_01280, partial [Neisseria sp. HMSC70E02]